MTPATYLLAALAIASGLGCIAFALPVRRLNPPHGFDADPFEDDGEHEGRHRIPDLDEDTTRLADSRLRAID